MSKVSIRFFNDKEVRAVWDETSNTWWFNVVDVCAVLSESDNPAVYWRVLKNRLAKAGNETVTKCNGFKFTAADGKRRLMDAVDSDGIITLAKEFPSKKANRFIDWFTYSDDSLDGKSKQKAYALFESSFADSIEIGTTKGLQQIHAYLFGGLYDFAGQIRTLNISKDGFKFAPVRFLDGTLKTIDGMPENTFEQIVAKYIEMNVAHPFLEGNGRATRIWLDLMLKKNIKKCVDWSKIPKKEYFAGMIASVSDGTKITALLQQALTNKINDREMFMKGIDYSYYYEEEDIVVNE